MKRIFLSHRVVLLRGILALVLSFSGLGKLIDDSEAIHLVTLIVGPSPSVERIAVWVVRMVSVCELMLSALLIVGIRLHATLCTVFGLLLLLTLGLSVLWWRGLSVSSCGCFGAFGLTTSIELSLLRNLILLSLLLVGFLLLPSAHTTNLRKRGLVNNLRNRAIKTD